MNDTDPISQTGRASAIASIAHRHQRDKLDYAYIAHPSRVAANFDRADQPVEHSAAWLHDVIEDTDISAQDLLDAGIWPEVVEIVELLTRDAEETSEAYYERIRRNPLARAVKLADIADNLEPWRVHKLDPETRAHLAQKYQRARIALGADEAK
jgi:(p)ppGpp synthase/HD superfamily hydrolase